MRTGGEGDEDEDEREERGKKDRPGAIGVSIWGARDASSNLERLIW